MVLVLLCTELILLYILSQWLIESMFTLFLLLFRARSVAITIILLLQFPGTVIHELAHLFTAEILRVPTGKMTLVPESIREEHIRSGSVAIGGSDPFRRYTIGLAPVFWGIISLSALAYLLTQPYSNDTIIKIILYYLLFAISNSMFSSSEDLKGFWPFAITLGIFTAVGYWLGIRISVPELILTTLTQSLGIVLGLNIVLLVLSWAITMGITTLFRLQKDKLQMFRFKKHQ